MRSRRHCRAGEGPAPELAVPMKLSQGLRYGENPHQGAAFYTDSSLAENDMGGVATSVCAALKSMCSTVALTFVLFLGC